MDNENNLNDDSFFNEETKYSEDDKILFQISAGMEFEEEKNIEENIINDIKINNIKTSSSKKKKKKQSHKLAAGFVLITVILASSAVLALSIIAGAQDIMGITGTSNTKVIEITEGSNSNDIASILKENGIIINSKLFVAYCKYNNSGADFQFGEHSFSSDMSYEQIISELNSISKHQEQIKIMFREGITLNEAAQLLEENKVCNAKDFIQTFNTYSKGLDYEKLVKSDLKFYRMEGYFFPDTYNFLQDSSPEEVVELIRLNFNNKVYTKYYSKMQDAGLELDEVIKLASIVQSEADNIEDMKKVASVYFNRLNNAAEFPKLQSCPTRDYVEDVIIPNLGYTDDDMFNAYNTYEGLGLPPGAISNPGTDAIEAVLNPAKTDYYFFCSNLETKEFFYAKTDAEHEKNLVKAGLK